MAAGALAVAGSVVGAWAGRWADDARDAASDVPSSAPAPAFTPGAAALRPPHAGPRHRFGPRVGWAYAIQPDASPDRVRDDFARMRQLGCDTVYLAHPNPGDLDPAGAEPGLGPAVWWALTRETGRARDAAIILRAVTDALDAAERADLDVVLGIGYQIVLGDEWAAEHPNDLRRDAAGAVLQVWGSRPNASPYAPRVQDHLSLYYRWVAERVLAGRPRVVAINLADEPMGADYSEHARRAFATRYRTAFDGAPAVQQGEFLSGMLADYASWAAASWRELAPDLWTMMTLHVERTAPFFPDLERIFAETPDTFIVSADTHLDDHPRAALTPAEARASVNLLCGLTRTLGWLSRVYGRPLMLWTSANGWGLKREGGLSEAFLNLDAVQGAVQDVDGDLGMLMAWAWNVRGQGIYDANGAFEPPESPEQLVAALSAALVRRRGQRASEALGSQPGAAPGLVYWLTRSALYRAVARERPGFMLSNLASLGGLDFRRQRAVYLADGLALAEASRQGAVLVPLPTHPSASP